MVRFSDGSSVMMIANLDNISSAYLRKRTSEIVAMVDHELGVPPEEPTAGRLRNALFLYMHAERVVGCVICCRLKRAFVVRVPAPSSPTTRGKQFVPRTPCPAKLSSSKTTREKSSPDTVVADLTHATNDSDISVSSTEEPATYSKTSTAPAVIGISRVWVSMGGENQEINLL